MREREKERILRESERERMCEKESLIEDFAEMRNENEICGERNTMDV